MKQKATFKSLLVVAVVFSLCAFLYVNAGQGARTMNPQAGDTLVSTRLQEEDAEETDKMAVPDVTILGRLWEIAHRLVDHKNGG